MKKILTIFSLTILFAGSTAYAVWSDPISAPTGNNTEAPINESATAQTKSGGFSLGSLISESFIKLGVASTTCDSSIGGTVRFNNGLVEICTDEVLGSPVVSVDPGIPPACSNDQLAFYNTTTANWECGNVPETLAPCPDGQGVTYNSGNWTCSLMQNKFIDGTNPNDAVYPTGLVGIGTSDPEASIHIATGGDVTYTSTDHRATFGDHGGPNIGIDNNEILARNNGVESPLYLQLSGGATSIRSNAGEHLKFMITADGRVGIGETDPWTENGKLIIKNLTNVGPGGWYTSIKFTNNSHNSIWNPAGGMYFGMHSDGNFYYGDESGGTHQGYPMIMDSDNGNTTITGPLYVGDASPDSLRLSTGRNVFVGTGDMRIYGDNSSALYLDSNDSTYVQMIFRDTADVIDGRVYGSGDGATFGFLDRDGHWTMESVKDTLLRFRVNNSIKMTIENTGDVGIGITSPTHRLHVENDTTSYMTRFRQNKTNTPSDMLYLQINTASPGGDQGFLRFEDNAGTAHGYITGNGGSGVLFTAASDRRLKENIKTIDKDFARDKILSANPVHFVWRESDHKDFGYIAQDLKKIVPEAVVGMEGETEIIDVDGKMEEVIKYMMVNNDTMIPLIHSALLGEIENVKKMEDALALKTAKRKSLEVVLDTQQEQINFLLNKVNK